MCGVAGIRAKSPPEEGRVPAMLRLLSHRGPDDSGVLGAEGWVLGMTRLAILDVEHGRQPMTSADGAWSLVFNGEIYNFREIRALLEGRGVRLRTACDTEVLLESIAADGVVATLGRLEGMFAFAALDRSRGDLWLARDRFGEKPLFLDRRAGGFAFCSELSPLLQVGPAAKAVSWKGIASIFRYGYPWPGYTAVDQVRELLPAQWLRRSRDGREESGIYWHPPTEIDEQAGSLETCGERLLSLLDRSVEQRLVADVPLGLFLSGGIDSGAIAASAARHRPDIRAVTIGFDDADYDERPLARKTAQHLGISLEESVDKLGSFTPTIFDSILAHHGQPFEDTSAVPTRTVSKIARSRFKVVLSGDGGDELLGGYLSHRRCFRLSRLPGTGALESLARSLSNGLGGLDRLEKVERAISLYGAYRGGDLPHAMAGVFSDRQVRRLFRNSPGEREAEQHLGEALEDARRLWKSAKDPILALSLFQLRHSLPQDMLTKVDRMSMAESLEVRAPFLDAAFATYALSLPARLKVDWRLGKLVFRAALSSRLPSEVLRAPKRGFAMPVRTWLGESFWRELEREVAEYAREGGNELDPSVLEDQVRRDRSSCGRSNNYRALHRSILIYSFLRWRQKFLLGREDRRPVPA